MISPETNMQNENPNPLPQKRQNAKTLKTINWLFVGLGFVLLNPFCWIFLSITPKLTFRLLLPFLISGIVVVPICYAIHRKTGKLKFLLFLTRFAACAITAVLLLSPFVYPIIFDMLAKKPATYPLARGLLIECIYADERSRFLLPQKLPDPHDNLHFKSGAPYFANGGGRTNTILCMHTDQAALSAYEAKLLQSNHFTCQDLPCTEEERRYLPILSDDYNKETEYNSGKMYSVKDDDERDCFGRAIINYDTGLLLIWF